MNGIEGSANGVIVLPVGYEEIQAWVAKNGQVRAMHEIAIEDYIAARHSVLQLGLFTVGFALAAQAIEKLLKCYLMLDGAQLADMKKHSHNLDALFNAAVSNSPALQSNKVEFANLCAKLQAWYQSRYPFAPGSATEWMRADIAPIDRMVVYLEEHMPLPEAVASLVFAGGELGTQWNSIFVRLFSVTSEQHRQALVDENAALSGREQELHEKFVAARECSCLKAETAHEFEISQRKIGRDLNAALVAFPLAPQS
jgi:HEPN domain-containing protein